MRTIFVVIITFCLIASAATQPSVTKGTASDRIWYGLGFPGSFSARHGEVYLDIKTRCFYFYNEKAWREKEKSYWDGPFGCDNP